MESIVSRETIRARGAAAFDQGQGVGEHHMNFGAAAIKDWQFGWHTRRIERQQAAQQLVRSEARRAV